MKILKGKCFKEKQKIEFLNCFELCVMEFFLAVVAVDRDRDKKSRPRRRLCDFPEIGMTSIEDIEAGN